MFSLRGRALCNDPKKYGDLCWYCKTFMGDHSQQREKKMSWLTCIYALVISYLVPQTMAQHSSKQQQVVVRVTGRPSVSKQRRYPHARCQTRRSSTNWWRRRRLNSSAGSYNRCVATQEVCWHCKHSCVTILCKRDKKMSWLTCINALVISYLITQTMAQHSSKQ